jgi:hypothetical protein
MQRVAETNFEMRRPEPRDAELVAKLDAPSRVELFDGGFVLLGELIVEARASAAAYRVYVDTGGTTIGYAEDGLGSAWLSLESILVDGAVITRRWTFQGHLSEPPFVKSQSVPSGSSLGEVWEQHRRLLATVDESRVVRMSSIDDVIRECPRAKARETRWRASQDPDTLLDQDLARFFGSQLHEAIPHVKRYLAKEPIPRATLLR